MLKTACFFTGDNYSIVAAESPNSKKKIVALAIAMIVPVLLYLFSGFMLSYQILKAGVGWALLTGLVLATMIFILEKLIVMGNGHKLLARFRVAIGLVVALLGSLTIDEIVFKPDIDNEMPSIKSEIIERAKSKEDESFKDKHQYASLEENINKARTKFDSASRSAMQEADGSMGTKTKGFGRITILKLQEADKLKKDLDRLLANKNVLDSIRLSRLDAEGDRAGQAFNDHSLLMRIKALFRLVSSDRYMRFYYILLTLLILFIEFIVIILKKCLPESTYERKMAAIEEIGKRRLEFLLKGDSPLNDPGYFLPQLKDARNSLKKNNSMFH